VRTTALFRWDAAHLGYCACSNKHLDSTVHVRRYSAEPSFALIHIFRAAVWCAAPVVSSGNPINIALSEGGIITIGGLSFADSANFTPTSSIWMSGACGSTAWTSLSAVSCTSRAYKGDSLYLGVTLSAMAGTRSARFSFDGASAILSLMVMVGSVRSISFLQPQLRATLCLAIYR
jgi:hypothetical protein